MNMFKKNEGFTLVELIVVIAILAILAAVAVPAYSGYITKAEEANDVTQLDGIKTAAVFAYTEKAALDSSMTMEVTKIEVPAADGVVDTDAVEVNDVVVDVTSYVDGVEFKSATYADGATWNGEKWAAN